MDEWINTSMTDDGTGVQKPTMNAFHTSQHVTGPQTRRRNPYRTACSSQEGAGGRGGETNQSAQHACCRGDPVGVRAARPTCGGSSTASERGTAANALYACLTFMGNSSGEVGEGARGCRGVGWGGGKGGYMVKEAKGKKRRWEGRTDRDMEER